MVTLVIMYVSYAPTVAGSHSTVGTLIPFVRSRTLVSSSSAASVRCRAKEFRSSSFPLSLSLSLSLSRPPPVSRRSASKRARQPGTHSSSSSPPLSSMPSVPSLSPPPPQTREASGAGQKASAPRRDSLETIVYSSSFHVRRQKHFRPRTSPPFAY